MHSAWTITYHQHDSVAQCMLWVLTITVIKNKYAGIAFRVCNIGLAKLFENIITRMLRIDLEPYTILLNNKPCDINNVFNNLWKPIGSLKGSVTNEYDSLVDYNMRYYMCTYMCIVSNFANWLILSFNWKKFMKLVLCEWVRIQFLFNKIMLFVFIVPCGAISLLFENSLFSNIFYAVKFVQTPL